jgi:hypothetical protein
MPVNSLCNVIYQLCSKVMANRLRLSLDDIVLEEQSAFCTGVRHEYSCVPTDQAHGRPRQVGLTY